jgi:hypothetical protein
MRRRASAGRERASAMRRRASAGRERALVVRRRASAGRERASAMRRRASVGRERALVVRRRASNEAASRRGWPTEAPDLGRATRGFCPLPLPLPSLSARLKRLGEPPGRLCAARDPPASPCQLRERERERERAAASRRGPSTRTMLRVGYGRACRCRGCSFFDKPAKPKAEDDFPIGAPPPPLRARSTCHFAGGAATSQLLVVCAPAKCSLSSAARTCLRRRGPVLGVHAPVFCGAPLSSTPPPSPARLLREPRRSAARSVRGTVGPRFRTAFTGFGALNQFPH